MALVRGIQEVQKGLGDFERELQLGEPSPASLSRVQFLMRLITEPGRALFNF